MNLMSDANRYMIDNATEGNLIDIGACTGVITLAMAERIKDIPFKVYGIEPDPDAFEEFKKNTTDISNIVGYQAAISNQTGDMKLFLSQRGGHTTSETSAATGQFGYNINRNITVSSYTMDDFVAKYNINNITGIKIDVEASEQFVIEGAKKTLTENKILIALETHSNIDCLAVYKLLLDYGYVIYDRNMVKQEALLIGRDYICRNY